MFSGDRDKVQHPNLWETVFERIRAAIVAGHLKAGDRMVETELAERYGVSRGPVREALRELARHGLAIEMPRRGMIVSGATLTDLIEIYDIREALEQVAVRNAIAKATPDDYSRLRRDYRAMERAWHGRNAYQVKLAADLAFHGEIFRMSGCARAAAFYDQLSSQNAVLFPKALDINPTLLLSPPDNIHADLEKALIQKDVEAAQAAVAAHYRHTRERLFATTEGPDQSPAEATTAPLTRTRRRVQARDS